MSIVDVIVPTYNRPGMLARALASIRAQTFGRSAERPYEIIVVNDGGEDVSQLCRMFGARQVRHDINRGLPAARNTGIRETGSKYIAYLDDDDVWLPEHLDRLIAVLQKGPGRLAYSDCIFWDYERKYELVYARRFDRSDLLAGTNMAPVICVVHERSLLEEVGMFDEALPSHEDYDLWLRMSEVTDFEHVSEVTALYSRRFTPEQMSFLSGKMVEGHNRAIEKAVGRRERG